MRATIISLTAVGAATSIIIWADRLGAKHMRAEREHHRISNKKIFQQCSDNGVGTTGTFGTIIDTYILDDDQIEWFGVARGNWGDAHAVANAVEKEHPEWSVDVRIECEPIQYVGMSMECKCTDTYTIKYKQ